MGLSFYNLPLCHIAAHQTAEGSSSAITVCKGGDAKVRLNMRLFWNDIAKDCSVS
jgi:hypothetical protein